MSVDTDITPYHFGWYWVKDDGKLDFSIMREAMRCEHFNEFRHYTKVIEELRPYHIDYLALEADALAVEGVKPSIEAEFNKMAKNGFFDVARGVKEHAQAQRAVSNYLGAASAFIGRSATRLSNNFGKEKGGGYDTIKRVMSGVYDASFGYRLISVLRNHAQHHENPLSIVTTNIARDDNGNPFTTIGLQLDTAMLINNVALKASFRKEISERGAEKIDIMPIIAENKKEIRAIFACIIKLFAPRLDAMIHYGQAIYQVLEPPQGAFPCIFIGPKPEKMIFMGFDELADYIHLLVSLDNEIRAMSDAA